MSVLSYINNLASDLNIAEKEKDSIESSISALDRRLDDYFGDEINEKLQFGSSTRNTMLPREADSNSDVDYLVIFDSSSKPQTYLNKLKSFADKYYFQSIVKQSSPAIVLSLNHINFDLVPGKKTWFFFDYKIPSPNDYLEDWKGTNLFSLNSDLNNLNKESGYKLKKAIRVVKYWNALNDYVYDSFELEKNLVEHWFSNCNNTKEYFYECVDCITSYGWSISSYKKRKLDLLNEKKSYIQFMENANALDEAEKELDNLIPQL